MTTLDLGNHCFLGIIMHHASSYFGRMTPSNHDFNFDGLMKKPIAFRFDVAASS